MKKQIFSITMLATLGLSVCLFSKQANAQTAYITNDVDNTVSVIDVATNTVTATIPVGFHPWGVSVCPNGSKVYITNYNDNTVNVINSATDTVTATIPVGTRPNGISVSPDGLKVYVTNAGDNTVSVINSATNTVTATITVGISPMGVSISPDGSKVYVANINSDTVSVISTTTDIVTAKIPVGTRPVGISVSPDGSKVYVANNNTPGKVSVINTATNTVTATITIGSNPYGISISPDGSTVYVANNVSNTVSVINTATNSVSATIAVGAYPEGLSVSPDGSKVYVANMNANTISVINTTTNNVTATITVGSEPYAFGNFISTYKPPTITQTNVSCYGGNNGTAMVTSVNCGTPPYTYSLNGGTAQNDSLFSGLTAGTDTIIITDHNGIIYYPISITITQPPLLIAYADTNIAICFGSNAQLHASTNYTGTDTLTYNWSPSAGLSNDTIPDPIANPSATATYTVSVSTSSGCTASASVTVNVNSNPTPIITGPTQICADMNATLDAGAGYSSYIWSTGAISQTIMVNTGGTYTVTVTNASGCSGTASASLIVHPNPVIGVTASANPICAGASTTLTASGALAYTWSNSLGITSSVTAMPTANTTYIVSGTDAIGCTASANISISLVWPSIPNICMVTTDSATQYKYNVVCWDKTTYTNVDSFIVYRMDALSSSYLNIGAVSKNALSEFIDTSLSIGGPNGGNPMYSSWQYKLAIRDTCGNIGDKSPYHQTMFVQESGANFSWNAYTVETGQTNPITGYSFFRDDNNSGNWHVLINTTGLSATDPYYASYPNGNWRIDALGFDCAPTMKSTQTLALLKSHSNTVKSVSAGVEQFELNNDQLTIYPNPASDNLEIITQPKSTIEILNIEGQLIKSLKLTDGKTELDVSDFASGVYIIRAMTDKGIMMKKFVKE